jgi:hypothetical protein
MTVTIYFQFLKTTSDLHSAPYSYAMTLHSNWSTEALYPEGSFSLTFLLSTPQRN